MKITFYVDWDNRKVLNQDQYEERLSEAADELFADSNCLAEWLEENFTMIDVFQAGDARKEEIREDFRDYCQENADTVLDDDGEVYEKIDLDI